MENLDTTSSPSQKANTILSNIDTPLTLRTEDKTEQNPQLWYCPLCAVTVNIFQHSDHLLSRAHRLQELGAETLPKQQPAPLVPLWYCDLCDQEVNIFARDEHLAGKSHGRKVSERGGTVEQGEEEVDIPVDLHPQSSYPGATARYTFYCVICATEFPVEDQELHTDATEICGVCGIRLHSVAMDDHNKALHEGDSHNDQDTIGNNDDKNPVPLPSASTTSKPIFLSVLPLKPMVVPPSTLPPPSNPPEDSFFCTPCSRVFKLVERASHVGGKAHRANLERGGAAKELEQFFCEICAAWKSNAGRSGHLKSRAHKKKAAEQAKIPGGAVIQATQQPPASANHHRPDISNIEQPDKIAASETFFCEVCKTTKSIEGRNDHLQSTAHKKKAAALMKAGMAATPKQPAENANTAEYTTTVQTFICDVCNMHISLADRMEHLQSKSHLNAADKVVTSLQPATPLALPSLSEPALPLTIVPDNGVSCDPPVLLYENPFRPLLRARETTYYCTICKRDAPDKQAHEQSLPHDRNASKLPGYKPPKGRFYCNVCEKSCDAKKRKRCHSAPAWTCDKCGKKMHADVKVGHQQRCKGKQ